MSEFILKEIKNANIVEELSKIGFDSGYRHKAAEKYKFKNIKIYSLTLPQANILKQIALSLGADCAVHREVITGKVNESDVILGGSYSTLRKIAEKLKLQPFSLGSLGEAIINQLKETERHTKIVGVLNITDNSFSDGGKYLSEDAAKARLYELFEEGADIVDIGAESTKHNSTPIDDEVQLSRILPVLNPDLNISIDTRSSRVAEECLKHGAKIINDVSGLKYDPKMADIIAEHGATVVIQHSLYEQNRGDNVQSYNSVVDDVYIDLLKQVKYAEDRGIKNIIIDVGIGFDKNFEDNFRLFNRLDEFKSMGYPIMLGISRKSFIKTDEDKDIYTLALNAIAIEHEIDYIRVHNVKIHKNLIDIYKNRIL